MLGSKLRGKRSVNGEKSVSFRGILTPVRVFSVWNSSNNPLFWEAPLRVSVFPN